MEWFTKTRLRLKALLLRGKFNRDMEDELAFHLAMREEQHRSDGIAANQAGATARKGFGNVTRIKEACREMRTFMSFESFWQDLRYGWRWLRTNPGFAVVALATLALGIGCSSWLFSMLRQWVIEAVAFPNSGQLVVLWEIDTKKGWTGPASAPDFLDWREKNQVMQSLTAWTTTEFNLTGSDTPQRIPGARVSANFFRTLGAQIAKGRDFLSQEEQLGSAHVAIVSYGLWQERLNGNPDLSHSTILLDGEPYTVIGVLPEDFHFTLMGRVNVWVPLQFTDKERTDRASGWLQVIGRRKPDIAMATARQAMSVIASDLEKRYPESNTNSGILLNGLAAEIGQHVGNQAVYTAFVAAICILLIACSNVAGIFLARALGRKKEIAVRLALGARRARVVRQLLSENILLLPPAIGLGLLLAYAGSNWVTAMIPYENRGYLPNYGRIFVDSATLIYAVAISLVSVFLFSLAPILEGRKVDVNAALKDQGKTSSAAPGSHRLRKVLVVGQVVLALTVLVPAGLTAKSLAKLLSVDPGFRPDHVLTARLSLPTVEYKEDHQVSTFYNELLHRLNNLPQVEAAAASQYIPFGNNYGGSEFRVEGAPAPDPGAVPNTSLTSATPGYLSTLGLTLVSGRFISDQDTANSVPVIVINQTLAQRYFPDQNALGRRLRLGHEESSWLTVVGVVKDMKQWTLSDLPRNQSYIPFTQAVSRSMVMVLRTKGDPMQMVSDLRSAVLAVDKNQPMSRVQTLQQSMDDEAAGIRLFTQFSAYFAVLALFLAAVGIYGVMAYLVEGRTREIGIRMACGAQPKTVLWLMLAGSFKLIAAGAVLGLALSWAVSRLLANLLFGVSTNDPVTYAASVLVLCAAILLACIVPLRRATRVDPMIVLRYE